jgi:aldose 1-epimerase
MTELLTLRRGATELVLTPEIGGGIAHWRHDGVEVMRETTPETLAARDPLGLANFPLVPWSNRIRDGRFRFAGREVHLPPHHGDAVNTIHGQGWINAWDVVAASENDAMLVYDHAPDHWPWAYRAEQRFTLADDGFTVLLSVENRSDDPMPAGLGQHPYYPNQPDATFHARLDGWWETDAAIMPVRHHAVEPTEDWSPWLHSATTTDNVFSGWNGRAAMTWPSRGLRVTMTAGDAARYMVVYAPNDGSVMVVEPVTHPTDAFNEESTPGIRVLAPGERMELEMRLTAERL